MLRPQFVVYEATDGWKIRHDGRQYGPYLKPRTAILAAIDAADRCSNSAFPPRVMVESRLTGKLQPEWTYGDPYPVDLEVYRVELAELGRKPSESRKWFVA